MLKISLLIMKRQIKTNVILTVLVSMLFLSVNFLLAGIKNSTVRYDPLKQYFEKQGVFVYGIDNIDEIGGAEEYIRSISAPQGFKTTAFFEGVGSNDDGVSMKVIICSDSFIDKLKLPIMSITHSVSGDISVTMPYNDSIGIGDTFTIQRVFPGKTFRVTKLLNSFSYSPTMSRYSSSNEDHTLFYETYNIDDDDKNIPFVLIKESDVADLEQVFPTFGFFVYYPETISDKDYSDLQEKLPEKSYIEFDTLRNNSNAKQFNNTLKYLPVGLAFAMTIVLGFICCIAVFSLQDMKRMEIFHMTGAAKSQFFQIYLIELSVVTIIAALINAVILIIFNRSGVNAALGLVYSAGNIMLTFAIVFLFVSSSVLIPLKLIYSKINRFGR